LSFVSSYLSCPIGPNGLRRLLAENLTKCLEQAIDFRLRDGVPYFLEVNPLPGLNPESSDLVIMARLAGLDATRADGNAPGASLCTLRRLRSGERPHDRVRGRRGGELRSRREKADREFRDPEFDAKIITSCAGCSR